MNDTPDAPAPVSAVAENLLALTAGARERLDHDPFGNPVMAVSLAISRMLDDGTLDEDSVAALVRHLRDTAFAARASRVAAYVGGTDPAASGAAMDGLARRLARPDGVGGPVPWPSFRDEAERTRFAAVFTAHPTFAMPRA